MNPFAIYRFPHSQQCTLIEQTSGEPQRLSSLGGLSERSGFVVAPFQTNDDTPILFIRPDHVSAVEVKEPSCNMPSIASEKDHHAEYAIDFANFHSQLETGAFQKIVLARSADISLTADADPMQLFWRACKRYPRLFIALVSLPDGSYWLTATPEILLEGSGNKWRTIALAGTMQLEGDQLQGEGEDVLVQRAPRAPAAGGIVYADVVDVQRVVLLHQLAAGVLQHAEAVAQHPVVVIDADEHGGCFILKDLPEFRLGVLGGGALEQVGPAVVVHHVHLHQQVHDGGDVGGNGRTNMNGHGIPRMLYSGRRVQG